MNGTTTPEREIEIVEMKTTRRVIPGTDGKLGPERPMTDADGPRFCIYVDGAYHGACRTRERADQAAAHERDRDETVTERAIRIIRDAEIPGVADVSMWHTGGGCLAAGDQRRRRDPGAPDGDRRRDGL